jgi:hypothetical protein
MCTLAHLANACRTGSARHLPLLFALLAPFIRIGLDLVHVGFTITPLTDIGLLAGVFVLLRRRLGRLLNGESGFARDLGALRVDENKPNPEHARHFGADVERSILRHYWLDAKVIEGSTGLAIYSPQHPTTAPSISN